MRLVPLAAAALAFIAAGTAAAAAAPPLLPLPARVAVGAGRFDLRNARVAASDAGERAAAARLIELLGKTGPLRVAPGENGTIRFQRNPAIAGAEAYRLTVASSGVTVQASTDAGLFYGAETLWQLIAASTDGTIAGTVIDDAPTFAWRGIMLDSARHFQTPEYVKSLIDRMASVKLNVLHWHLTDDQGWRLQIDRYPRLTAIGAWRRPAGAAGTDARGRPVRYGGFYSKADVRGIVAYAAARHVTIVPEIDVPGHATAAIAAYPELASVAHPPRSPSSDWGVLDNLFNTEDATFTFIENVLDEVLELFPSPYIHLGGDEAVKTQWVADPRAQARIKPLGLKNEAELQGWFVARLGDYLAKKGRKLVGWDEILDGNVPSTATVMSWHGTDGAVVAARAGHDAILAPSPDFYLDHLQSLSPDETPGRGDVIGWKQFYSTPVVPASLGTAERAHILGVQANLWTEHVRTSAYADRMLWPRAALLAELGWTPEGRRDWPNMAERLPAELAREAALGGAYDEAPLAPLAIFTAAGHGIVVDLMLPGGTGTLHLTTDGTAPKLASPAYTTPVTLASGTILRAQTFAGSQPIGAEKRWTLGPDLLRTRTGSELELCTNRVPLRLEDDAPTAGTRALLWGDIMHPCWIWHAASLQGVSSLSARVGQVPFNFALGADRAKVVFDKPQTAAGELLVRFDRVDAPIAMRIPLERASLEQGLSTVSGLLPPHSGTHDVYFSFAQDGPQPLWMLGSVTLEPAR